MMGSKVRSLWLTVVGLLVAMSISFATGYYWRFRVPENTAVAPVPIPTGALSPYSSNSQPTPIPELTADFERPRDENVASFVGVLHLIIPVVGVRPEHLQDTFEEARSEGRNHDAIDIMAPAGTAVVAAAEGQIVRLAQSELGGTTIYQLSSDKRVVYYYAHLQRYAPHVTEGIFVKQGDLIAYVGDTGNAGAGNYHLHFSIALVFDPTRYWEGTNINPYPLLRR